MGLQQMQTIQPSASLVYVALGIAHFAEIIRRVLTAKMDIFLMILVLYARF